MSEEPTKGKPVPDAEAAVARAKFKITVEHSDMTEEMQEQLKEMVLDAFVKHTVFKDLATSVKQAFDDKYPPPDNKATSGVYHCVVGERQRHTPRARGAFDPRRNRRLSARGARGAAARREQLCRVRDARDALRVPPQMQQRQHPSLPIKRLAL